ncbi:MAG: hypothetical protein JEZ11_14090 [Desulfobacterales bacterium]|nr:hypothetical protein [Desulfobacterales bacterium]
MIHSPLEKLALADPELAGILDCAISRASTPVPLDRLGQMVDQILTALSQEISFGVALARAYGDLLPVCDDSQMKQFTALVEAAGQVGPSLGRIITEQAVPVFSTGSQALIDAFRQTTAVMGQKGTYTLGRPLEALGRLLIAGDTDAGMAFLTLLSDTFSRDMTYNQSLHLTRLIPRAVTKMAADARSWQIRPLNRVLLFDLSQAEPFLDGMEKGLCLLSEKALTRFVDTGLERCRRNADRGQDFLSLTSREATTAFRSLQVAVSLTEAASRINRYLRARTGKRLSAKPLSALPQALAPDGRGGPVVCSDGCFIYLPETIGVFKDRERNLTLYQDLARLESAPAEFGTFDFDLERLSGRYRRPEGHENPIDRVSDMEAFFRQFDDPALAESLLTIAEHGRLQRHMARRYAGLARRLRSVLGIEAGRMRTVGGATPLDRCYARVVLGDEGSSGMLETAVDLLDQGVDRAATVEDCARLVADLHETFAKGLDPGRRRVNLPFGRRLRPDLFLRAHQETDHRARALQQRLREKGIRVYRADLFQKIQETAGVLKPEDIQRLAQKGPAAEDGSAVTQAGVPRSMADLASVLNLSGGSTIEDEETDGAVFWYPEWAGAQGDYLDRHCRVLERAMVPARNDDLFAKTLERHHGLVRRIRYAFELLRPEGLTILRQWVEGDDFDYRALLDFAMDRRAGLMPSDRLYIKRLKQQRDVAVLLLVDLSRSTANSVSAVNGTGTKSVLDMEKEALVLFCEALGVVGDRFAMAGFSGTGRLGVDYYRVKDFDEPMGPEVRRRISGMVSQRSTRMGAAIRHATASLEGISAAVRLMILIGDGFPNDVDYKGGHAIEDTRRAINEARSKTIFTHGITVNVAADPMLDDLYGSVRHNIISDVRELPDKLLRIYGALTR